MFMSPVAGDPFLPLFGGDFLLLESTEFLCNQRISQTSSIEMQSHIVLKCLKTLHSMRF
jgi:hypothetical protein